MRGFCAEPPETYSGVTSYLVYSRDFYVYDDDGKRHKGAAVRKVECLPDDDIEQGDTVEFKSMFPSSAYVHDRVIVKHIRSAESDLPVLPYVPFGAG